MTELEELRAENARLIEALKESAQHCLCERETPGFDYGEVHRKLGKPRMGARWMTPLDLISNRLTQSPRSLVWLEAFKGLENAVELALGAFEKNWAIDWHVLELSLDRARMLRSCVARCEIGDRPDGISGYRNDSMSSRRIKSFGGEVDGVVGDGGGAAGGAGGAGGEDGDV